MAISSRAGRSISALAVLFTVYIAVAQARDKPGTLPQRVLLIRHAEKPPDESSVHLAAEGQKRAEELYHLFEQSAIRPVPLPTPGVIFAAKASKHSNRSVETVSPLAKRLKLTINANYRDEDFAELAHEVLHNPKYAAKTVLICWHHGLAPQLATRLGAPDVPKSWKGSVFDRVWEISYGEQGKTSFRDRPQQLLGRDSER